MNLGKFAVDAIKAWNPLSQEAYERRDRNKAYRKARRKAKRGEAVTEEEYEILNTTQEDTQMGSLKGALMSKLVWLGLVQIGYSLFETWSSGGLNAEVVSTAISGVLTIIFRAMTDKSLADKSKPAA